MLQPPQQAPPLELRNYLGQKVNIDSYRGKAVLVTFLYTDCPDICPLIASDLGVAETLMSSSLKSKVQMIAVSVDPRNDTPKAVAAFLASHGLTGKMQYLIGSKKELAPVWEAWKVGSSREIEQPQFVDHTGLVYGITGSGKKLTVLPRIQALGNRPRRAAAGGQMSWGRGSSRLTGLAAGLTALVAIAAFVVFGLASKTQPPGGRPAPALPRESLSGPSATLASLESSARGRAAVIVFWASWCASCAQEAPAFERFYRSREGHGRVVGVDWSDPETWAAMKFVHRYGWTFPNLRDLHGLVGNDYGLGAGLPDTFVVSARGRIDKVLRGPQSVQSLRTALAQVERS